MINSMIDHARTPRLFLTADDDAAQDATIPYFRGFIRQNVAAGLALEIGPSYNPILPKKEGCNVVILDHEDQAGLQAKYATSPVDVSNIEPVDIVWKDGPLRDALAERLFTAVVTSHAIEHAPDLVQSLQDCEAVLESGGRLYLIIPDKRYCFDYFQPVTDVAKILSDHLSKRTRHSFESFYRHSVTVSQKGRGDWGQHPVEAIRYMHADPCQNYQMALNAHASREYIDSHENYFTPLSFKLIIDELLYLGLVSLDFDVLTRSRGCEFLAVLQKVKDGERLSLDRFLERKLSLQFLRMQEEQEWIKSGWTLIEPLNSAKDRV